MERYMGHMIRSTEIKVQKFLDTQVLDTERPDYGAMRTEMREPKPTIYVMALAAAVYCHKDSRFYHDSGLLKAMNLAMDFVGRCQRENGGLDYPSCNFNSAADTSFCFKRLISGYRVLDVYEGDNEEVALLKETYSRIMKHALEMICSGGFHTPNHRWGIAAALLQGAGLYRSDECFAERLRHRAMQYLAEGIDGSPEGEYAERSTGNYNAVVNNAMMAMYEETKDSDFLGFVARNLDMMLTYIDSDDTIFTQNSTRQDQGKADYPDKYFYQYLYMASLKLPQGHTLMQYHDKFDAAAHKIIRDNMVRGDLAPECLPIIMLHPEMETYHFEGCGYLDSYRSYYETAGVLRVKKEKYGYSVLRGKSDFLFMKIKDMLIYVKIGESIGNRRNFAADTMEVKDGECILTSTVDASYYQPFAADKPAFPLSCQDWWEMDHSAREILVNSQLFTKVIIREEENGLTLSVRTEGLDGVPVRLQFCVPAGSVIENEQFYLEGGKGQSLILRDSCAKIRYKERTIKLGPGFGTHEFKGHYNGETVNDTGFTIFMNDYTEFDREIRIEVK